MVEDVASLTVMAKKEKFSSPIVSSSFLKENDVTPSSYPVRICQSLEKCSFFNSYNVNSYYTPL
jgi:hypothetical protein